MAEVLPKRKSVRSVTIVNYNTCVPTPGRCPAPGWLLTRCPRCWACWPPRRGRSCWRPPSPPSSGSAEPSRPSSRTACRWTGLVGRLFMMFIFYSLVAVPVSQYAQHRTGGLKILCSQLSTKFCQGGWHFLCMYHQQHLHAAVIALYSNNCLRSKPISPNVVHCSFLVCVVVYYYSDIKICGEGGYDRIWCTW